MTNQQEGIGNITLRALICRYPLKYIVISAMLPVAAAFLAFSPGLGKEYYWRAIGLAVLGGICPAYVLWCEAIGSVKLRNPVWVLVFIGVVLAGSTFVITAQCFGNRATAAAFSLTTVLLYVVSRIVQHKRDKKTKDTEAVHLRNEQRDRFLSIAVDELFDAVKDVHNRAPETRDP